MKDRKTTREHHPETPQDPARKRFEEPKLTYVPPKLSEHGKVDDVTQQGFFGPFSP